MYFLLTIYFYLFSALNGLVRTQQMLHSVNTVIEIYKKKCYCKLLVIIKLQCWAL